MLTFFVGSFVVNIPISHAGYSCTSKANGDWTNVNTWNNCGGSYPNTNDDITISHNVATKGIRYAASITMSGGTLTLAAGNGVYVGGNISGTGTISIADNAGFLDLGGDWSYSGTMSNNNRLNVIFSGSGNQTIATGSTTTFYAFTTNKSGGTATLMKDLAIRDGNLTITSGILDIGIYSANQTNPTKGILTINNGAKLMIGGTNSLPSGYTTYTIGTNTSTVEYYGTNQTVSARTYANLILSGSGVKTFPTGTTTINNTLSLQGTATTSCTGAVAYGGSATLEYKGSSAQTTSACEFVSPFTGSGGVKIENANGVTLHAARSVGANPFTIGSTIPNSIFNDGGYQLTSTGTLNLTSGTFKLGSSGAATSWPAFSTNNIASGTTVEYASGQSQNVSATPSYYHLTFSGAGTKTTGAGTTTVLGDWTTSGGLAALNTNNSNITVTGNIAGTGNITSGSGTISLQGAWTNNGTYTANTGTVNYAKTTGGQTVVNLPYYNLTLSNTSGTNDAGGNLSVGNVLTTTAGGTLDMGASYTLGGTLSTITNNGTIKTSVPTTTSATPIASGKTWGGTIEYASSSGSQTLVAGTFNNLTMSGSAGSTLGGNPTINGILTLSGGNIATGSNYVYIGSAGSVSRTTGHINGNLRKYIATGATTKTFEIGDSSIYAPVDVSFGNVSGAGDLTFSTTSGDHPNIGSSHMITSKSVNRYWVATNTGISFNNYAATFNFDSGDIDMGADYTKFWIAKYSGSDWSYITPSAKNTTNTQISAQTTFSDFQIGEKNTIPNAPTLVSPPNSSTTKDNTPTLSANYSDPDDNDTGFTKYRISSSGVSDCLNNINIVAYGTSPETSTNNEDTEWTPSSSIGDDGVYYWCAQNYDGMLESSWTTMGGFTLDTTPPTPSFTDNVAEGPVLSDTITASWGDAVIKKWDYSATDSCSTDSDDYNYDDTDSMDQDNEDNNGMHICLYGEDAAGNYATLASTYPINIDITPPDISFTDDVEEGPVKEDTITVDWDDADRRYWKYNDDTDCSTNYLLYPYTSANSMNQTTADNNGKYICLYAEDNLGNYKTLASAYSINIDITSPTLSFINNVSGNYVYFDIVSANWGDAVIKKWDYSATNSCSTDPDDYNYDDTDSMDQDNEDNNGMYICLYGEDEAGNYATLASTYPINIDATAPSGLTELVIGSTGSTSQVLSWSAVTESNFDHYEIWYGEDLDDVGNREGTADVWDEDDRPNLAERTTTSTTITGLSTTTLYYFKIWAVDKVGLEETVDYKSATTLDINHAPVLGRTADNILGSGNQITDTTGRVQIKFKVKDEDGETDTSDFVLGSAYYRVDGGSWNNIDDDSLSFSDVHFHPATDFSGTEYTLTWFSKNEFDNNSSDNVDFRFKVTDGDDESEYGISYGFSVDNKAPVITDGNISVTGGSGTGGAFIVGNTVKVTWNSSAGGDNNLDIATATANLSQFGGGSSVTMTDTTACGGTAGDHIYEACYTITGSEGIDTTNRNVSVAATDNKNNSTSAVWDTTNATVDTIIPNVSNIYVKIKSGSCTGTSGACKYGDNPILQWDGNSNGETDTIASVVFNGSSLKSGDSALSGSNVGSNVWEASLSGALDSQEDTGNTISVIVTDDAGNIVGPITSSTIYIVDTIIPTASGDLSDAEIAGSNSITLDFGSAGSDTLFEEYKIFYKAGSGGVTESDSAWTKADDANLGYEDYNSATSTTITGLSASTNYYFNIWIYDQAGNSVGATEVGPITTESGNSAPSITSITASQQTSTGYVKINYMLSDTDSDDCDIIVYEYSLTGAWTGEEETMTQASSDPEHDGVSSLSTSPTGIGYVFMWDALTDLGDFYDNTVYVRLKANDGMADSSFGTSASFAVDVKMPAISEITAVQSTDGSQIVTINYTLSDDTTSDLYVELEISDDGGSTWLVDTSSATGALGNGITAGSKTITWNVGNDLPDEENTEMRVRIRATDAFQNQNNYEESSDFTIDTLKPTTSLDSTPPLTTASTSATFGFSSEAGATFQCRLDGGSFTACTSPKSYTGLYVGFHTFFIKATDTFGNQEDTVVEYTWEVTSSGGGDITPPITTITSKPSSSTTSTSASFSFTANEPATFECKLDSGSFASCTSPKTYSSLSLGSHTFYIRATDGSSNVEDPPISYTWNIKSSGGGGGGIPAPPPATPTLPVIPEPPAGGEQSQIISGKTGGEFTSKDGGVEILVPADAYSDNIVINLEIKQNNEVQKRISGDIGEQVLIKGFDAEAYNATTGERILRFEKDLTIYVDYGLYHKEIIDEYDENTLQLYLFDEITKKWIAMSSEVDMVNNIIRAEINHFSLYAIFGKPKATTIPVEEKFGEYIVQSGESLKQIARKLYGDSEKWLRLVELNQDRYPSLSDGGVNTIYSGWSLKYDLGFITPALPPEQISEVIGGTYEYQLINQSPYPTNLQPGEEVEVWLEVKNTGTATWRDNVRLGTGSKYGSVLQGYDYDSEVQHDSWLSSNRPTSISPTGIIPGWHTRLQFKIKAPLVDGVYKAYFTPVADGISWMNDIGIYWEIRVGDKANQPILEPIATPQAPIVVENFGEYVVQPGESLKWIAQKVYGDSEKWTELVALNKDRYPSLIYLPNVLYSEWVLRYKK